jgi:hypothetical protein
MSLCSDRYSRVAASVEEVVPPNLTAKISSTLMTLEEASGALSTLCDEMMSSIEGTAGYTMFQNLLCKILDMLERGVTGAVISTLANVM